MDGDFDRFDTLGWGMSSWGDFAGDVPAGRLSPHGDNKRTRHKPCSYGDGKQDQCSDSGKPKANRSNRMRAFSLRRFLTPKGKGKRRKSNKSKPKSNLVNGSSSMTELSSKSVGNLQPFKGEHLESLSLGDWEVDEWDTCALSATKGVKSRSMCGLGQYSGFDGGNQLEGWEGTWTADLSIRGDQAPPLSSSAKTHPRDSWSFSATLDWQPPSGTSFNVDYDKNLQGGRQGSCAAEPVAPKVQQKRDVPKKDSAGEKRPDLPSSQGQFQQVLSQLLARGKSKVPAEVRSNMVEKGPVLPSPVKSSVLERPPMKVSPAQMNPQTAKSLSSRVGGVSKQKKEEWQPKQEEKNVARSSKAQADDDDDDWLVEAKNAERALKDDWMACDSQWGYSGGDHCTVDDDDPMEDISDREDNWGAGEESFEVHDRSPTGSLGGWSAGSCDARVMTNIEDSDDDMEVSNLSSQMQGTSLTGFASRRENSSQGRHHRKF